MGMLGRYIDGLTAEQKDRVIEAQGWTRGQVEDRKGNRCLVGHAVGGARVDNLVTHHIWMNEVWGINIGKIGERFDDLHWRFDQRLIHAIKLRAGKPQPVLQSQRQQYILQSSHNTPAEV